MWLIEGGPGLRCLNVDETCAWTTLNTAIRYVLEKRKAMSDPIARKNADQTLSKLLKMD